MFQYYQNLKQQQHKYYKYLLFKNMNDNSGYGKSEFLSPKNVSNYTSNQTQSRRQPDLSAVYQYVPTLRQSGFIVGNPIAYTNQPFLPPHMSSPISSSANLHSFPNSGINNNSRYISQSPQRDRSQSRVLTHITYGNPPSPPPPRTTYYTNIPATNTRLMTGSPFINSPSSPSKPSSSFHTQNLKNGTIASDMVSRNEHERCKAECIGWQEKYRQLQKSINNISGYGDSNNGQYEQLRVQNQRLREKVRRLQTKQQSIMDDMEGVIISLVNKYRDSTLKECMLLTDRYRLEKKANQRM